MTKQEIAQWIRGWMKDNPGCRELDSMYVDFRSYGADRLDIGALTKLIYGMNPLKYMTSIPDGMFYKGDCTDVIIPNNIKSIDNSAFYSCDSLISVTIPDSVTSIGNSVFYFCDSLTRITIPDSVTSIGSSAFYYCTSLTSVTIPNGVTSIGDNAFSRCEELTEINFTGTKAQWNSIQLGKSWDVKSALRFIKCTDDIITL